MEKDNIVRPSPWCQEEIWRTVYGFITELNYIDNPWFPTVLKFTVARDGVIIDDESSQSKIELQKGRIIVTTRMCVISVTKDEIRLYRYCVSEPEEGRFIYFDKNIVPFLDKEYYEAEEIYEKLRHIFKVLVGHVADKLGF
jgi:hypothetical protein